jgi:hypothetical protein
MKTTLNWEKGTFKSTYKIYSENILVGKLKEISFAQSADGELNGKTYSFKTKGFFKKETQIIDSENGSTIGKITYNSRRTKAKIEYSDRVVNLKYNNAWNTKWSLFDSEGVQINYHGSSTKGKIEFDTQNDLLALSGLFITNYYRQITFAVFIAVFTTVFTTIFITVLK